MNMPFTPGDRGRYTRRFIDRRMEQLDIEPLDETRGVVRFGLICLGLFVLLMLVFALVVPISGAAVTKGQVIAAGDKLVVQPREAGQVTQVLVHEGQAVRAGQPLIRLDPLRNDAQLTQSQARYDALRAEEARLVAQRAGRGSIAFPADLTARAGEPRVAAMLALERAELSRHQAVMAADRQINASEIIAARAQAAATRRQQELINDELTGYRELYNKGFARKTTVRALQRNAAQIEADRAATTGAAAQAAIQSRRIRDAQALDTNAQLDQAREQLAQLEPQMAIARDVAQRSVLRAPANGRVSGLAELGPGTTVAAGRTLLELVPDGRPMIIEVQVQPRDIDNVRIGQEATIRFSSVNVHGRTSFPGRVISLSPNRVGGRDGDHYLARIRFDDPAAARAEGLVLQPGLPVSANIKTAPRNLFQYLFFPVTDAASRAFRGE